jgi:hypothetical protein
MNKIIAKYGSMNNVSQTFIKLEAPNHRKNSSLRFAKLFGTKL